MYLRLLTFFLLLLFSSCKSPSPPPEEGNLPTRKPRTYRILAGVSMGGYGAAYIGTRFQELFDYVGIMGGPTDWDHAVEVLRTWGLSGFLPEEHGYPFTYEALNRGVDGSPFSRSDYLTILKDLTLLFGNIALYNPDNSYYPPSVRLSDSVALRKVTSCTDPVVLPRFYDREYNNPSRPFCASYPNAVTPSEEGLYPVITFCDGGGIDRPPYAFFDPSTALEPVEIGLAVDCNGNFRRDPGEPVIRQFWEPWEDTGTDGIPDEKEPNYDPVKNPDPNKDNYDPLTNPWGTEKNLRYDPGEPFLDSGLDGIFGVSNLSPDPFEGNGKWDRNPNMEKMDRLNPRLCLENSSQVIPRYYLDGGVKDPFRFAESALRFLGTLKKKGERIQVFHSFSELTDTLGVSSLTQVSFPRLSASHILVIYGDPRLTWEEAIKAGGDGGHVGTPLQVIQRILTVFKFITQDLPPGSPQEVSFTTTEILRYRSELLGTEREIAISFPPGFQKGKKYPVIYFLHGHGMDPQDTSQAGYLLEVWMAQGILPPAFIVYPDGRVVKKAQGSFFANHQDTSGQDPYRYADAFLHEVIPLVENRYPLLTNPNEVNRYPQPDTGCE